MPLRHILIDALFNRKLPRQKLFPVELEGWSFACRYLQIRLVSVAIKTYNHVDHFIYICHINR